MEEIKDWLIPISTFITLISTSIGIWLSLKQYRIKLFTEIRLKESSRAEMDIRLLKLFTEILIIATGRKGEIILSDKIVEELVKNNKLDFTDLTAGNMDKIRTSVARTAILEPLVGQSSLSAAFASIATLAIRHRVLRLSALQALEDFKEWQPELSQKYIDEINAHTSNE